MPHRKGFPDELLANCNMKEWGSLNRMGAACTDTDLRALPTDRPFFRDPSLAGEGPPFDYLQNSRVKGGEPLFVGHLSTDGAWAFVETGYTFGWVRIGDIGFVGKDLAEKWMDLPQAFIIEDGVGVTDLDGVFRFQARIGTVLPLLAGGSSRGYLRVGLPVRGAEGDVVMKEAIISSSEASSVPLELTQWNVAVMINRMLGTPYGWGDSGGNRDCSGAVRDLFAPFGIWLPRNSAAQARAFPFSAFPEVSGDEKERRLVMEAEPFATLLRVPGHIMVYLGTFRGKPSVFHSLWGVRTLKEGKEGRHVLGAAVITTLRPGEGVEDFDASRGDLADRLLGMTLITGLR